MSHLCTGVVIHAVNVFTKRRLATSSPDAYLTQFIYLHVSVNQLQTAAAAAAAAAGAVTAHEAPPSFISR